MDEDARRVRLTLEGSCARVLMRMLVQQRPDSGVPGGALQPEQ
jgi:hypothetical protein